MRTADEGHHAAHRRATADGRCSRRMDETR